MLRSFFLSRRWALWAWGGGLIIFASVWIEVQVQVLLNDWYGNMWNLMQLPDPNKIEQFTALLLRFCALVFPLIVLGVFTSFFVQHYTFRWRQAMTFSYLPYWQKVEEDVEGASQRLQEDTRQFARITETLGVGLFKSILTLIAFIPILSGLSQKLHEQYHEWKNAIIAGETPPHLVDIANLEEKFSQTFEQVADGILPVALRSVDFMANTPHSLLWLGVIIALCGTLVAGLVGIKLPGLEYNNQKVEARFRKRLVYAEDDKKFISPQIMIELFTGLRFNYFRLFLHYTYFRLYAIFFAQFVIIVDLILIGPAILYGIILFGFLNQVSHAFSKVTESFAYFVNQWTQVTELLSIIKRLREFEVNIGYRSGRGAGHVPQNIV